MFTREIELELPYNLDDGIDVDTLPPREVTVSYDCDPGLRGTFTDPPETPQVSIGLVMWGDKNITGEVLRNDQLEEWIAERCLDDADERAREREAGE